MKEVFIDVLNHIDRIPNLNDILSKEYELTTKWKNEGKLVHLFVKENRTGAILVMKGVDIDTAKKMIATMPMHSYFEKVDYSYVDEQF